MKKPNGFRKLFLIATLISLIFASCGQPSNESKTENITVKVEKDSHVTKAPDSFSITKGAKLGFTALKEKMKLEFEASYELSKITLNDASGAEITNASPYVFNADTTIYLSSGKQNLEKVRLAKLEVAGKSIGIQDVMDAGKTREDKVLLDAKANFADADINFEPELKGGYWELKDGKQSLNIKVKRGTDERVYTLNIEKVSIAEAFLKKITIDDVTKEGTEIESEMIFAVDENADEVTVKVETDPKGAKVEFNHEMPNGKLTLSQEETMLTIKVGTAPKINEYTVFIKKLPPPSELEVDYEFNGKDEYSLSPDFVEKLKLGANPNLNVQGKYLNILLRVYKEVKSIKINNEVLPDNKIEKVEDSAGDYYEAFHSIWLGQGEKEIEIEIIPLKIYEYNVKNYKFTAKGDGVEETINPFFEGITDDYNLPKEEFINKLATGEKPLYKVYGDVAKMLFGINAYEYNFLCDEVKVNGEKVEFTRSGVSYNLKYKTIKDIQVNPSTPVSVKIEFIPKAGLATPVTWEFQLQGGGEKPSLPQSEMKWFGINGFMLYGNKELKKEFKDHLFDGTNPEFAFDGKEALVEVGSAIDGLIKEVTFKIDNEEKAKVATEKEFLFNIAKYKFEVSDTDPHLTEVIIWPKDEQRFKELKYSFMLKSSDNKLIPPLTFSIDGLTREDGYSATLQAETASLEVTAKKKLMAKIEIGEEGGHLTEVDITKIWNKVYIWQGWRVVSLVDNTGKPVEKTFVIRVTPIEQEKYKVVECKYTLKGGTKVDNNNAEFVFVGQKPRIKAKIKWTDGIPGEYPDEYGAKAVNLIAYAKNTRAHVKYQFVDIDNNPVQGQQEHEMTNTNGEHNSGEIALLTDKPTRIKIWVVAENGSTKDDTWGLWYENFNPVPLTWGYELKTKGGDYETKAYDTIEIEKDSVKDNKIYLAFLTLYSKDGYSIDTDGLAEGQEAFVALETAGAYRKYHRTSVDVSGLLDGTKQELKAILKMKKKNVDCLTYEVKIKLKG